MYLAVLGGLHCCSGFSLAVASRGCPPLVVCRLPSAVASLSEEQGLQGAWVSIVWPWAHSFGSWTLVDKISHCGAWASSLHGTWDLPRPGIELLSPTLAGEFFTTEPPGKSSN